MPADPGLLIARHRARELTEAVRDRVVRAKREVFGSTVVRTGAQGNVPSADAALLAEITSAVCL